MDFMLVSTENDDNAYFADASDLTDSTLQRAVDELGRNRSFHYLPAASLTAMSPPSDGESGTTIGTLTVFRGGRMQWSRDGLGGLAQDWRIPHAYCDTANALRLWQALRSAEVDTISRERWITAQVKLCPICGFDLSHLEWACAGETGGPRTENAMPPLTVPPYGTCGGCETTFGVDWIGATYGQMRQWWLEKICPWWMSGQVPQHIAADPAALQAFARLSRDLMMTPTDHPLSSATPD